MNEEYSMLFELWKDKTASTIPGNLGRHLSFGKEQDYFDIAHYDTDAIQKGIDEILLSTTGNVVFEHLLHEKIKKASLKLYVDGHLRESVLNGITAVFDVIRGRTQLDMDGDKLVGKVFAIDNPILVLSELDTESGKNDQKGFIQIFKGAYQGIRNPKSHSLNHDLNNSTAGQYLVLASLLMRRVEDAKLIKAKP